MHRLPILTNLTIPMRRTLTTLVCSSMLLMLWGCGAEPAPISSHDSLHEDTVYSTDSIPDAFLYDLDAPSATFGLPAVLEEISALAISTDSRRLYAVQDEAGVIFELSPTEGKIVGRYPFHKDGDYEGIAMVGDTVYVLKSTGTLYRVTGLGTPQQQRTKYKTDLLSRANDTEGLTYDAARHRLLIACKSKPGNGDLRTKAIYSFDLASRTYEPTPAYTLSLDSIRRYIDLSPAVRRIEKVRNFFTNDNGTLTFSPSSIAIHPTTGDIYLLSSVGKLLVVINPAGQVLHISKLDKRIHRQPEGMTFDRYGNLYISNEAKDATAKLHVFRRR